MNTGTTVGGGKCPIGKCPRLVFLGDLGGAVCGEMYGSGFFLGRICPGGNFPGGNCPHGGIVREGNVQGELSVGELTVHPKR